MSSYLAQSRSPQGINQRSNVSPSKGTPNKRIPEFSSIY